MSVLWFVCAIVVMCVSVCMCVCVCVCVGRPNMNALLNDGPLRPTQAQLPAATEKASHYLRLGKHDM